LRMAYGMVTSHHGLDIEIDLERFVKAVGHLSKSHGQIELHELLLAQPLFQLVHERFRGADGFCEFLGILNDEFLQIIIYRTRFVVHQLIDLLFAEPSP
jgi:hypothetical protein